MEQSVTVPMVVPRSVRVKRARWRDFVGVSWGHEARFGCFRVWFIYELANKALSMCVCFLYSRSLSFSSLSFSHPSLSLSLYVLLVCVWECKEVYCCGREWALFYIGVRVMKKSMLKCSPSVWFLLEVVGNVNARTFLDLCVLYSHTYKLK